MILIVHITYFFWYSSYSREFIPSLLFDHTVLWSCSQTPSTNTRRGPVSRPSIILHETPWFLSISLWITSSVESTSYTSERTNSLPKTTNGSKFISVLIPDAGTIERYKWGQGIIHRTWYRFQGYSCRVQKYLWFLTSRNTIASPMDYKSSIAKNCNDFWNSIIHSDSPLLVCCKPYSHGWRKCWVSEQSQWSGFGRGAEESNETDSISIWRMCLWNRNPQGWIGFCDSGDGYRSRYHTMYKCVAKWSQASGACVFVWNSSVTYSQYGLLIVMPFAGLLLR